MELQFDLPETLEWCKWSWRKKRQQNDWKQSITGQLSWRVQNTSVIRVPTQRYGSKKHAELFLNFTVVSSTVSPGREKECHVFSFGRHQFFTINHTFRAKIKCKKNLISNVNLILFELFTEKQEISHSATWLICVTIKIESWNQQKSENEKVYQMKIVDNKTVKFVQTKSWVKK